jgi:hypothetical protein
MLMFVVGVSWLLLATLLAGRAIALTTLGTRFTTLSTRVGVSWLVLATVLASRATALATLATRVRSRGLSTQGATGAHDGILYRE